MRTGFRSLSMHCGRVLLVRIPLLFFSSLLMVPGLNAQDRDGDGYKNDVDNCPWMVNPLQMDYNANGVGDSCEESIFLSKRNRSLFFSGSDSEAIIEYLVPVLPPNGELVILQDDSGFDLIVEENSVLATYRAGSKGGKVVMSYLLDGESITDTLSVRVMSKFLLNRVEGKQQHGYDPIHYSNDISYEDGLFELENEPPFHFEFINPILESEFIVKDLDDDGLKDLIGGIPTLYSVDQNNYYNVARLLIPIYFSIDKDLNIQAYHESIAYPEVLFHNQDWGQGPSIYGQTDTLFSLGEHYHSPVFPDFQGPANISNAANLLHNIGIYEGVHYDDWGFKRHHFTTFNNGRAKTHFNSIDLSSLDELNDTPFVNPLSYAYGDIDNDGQKEWLIGSQVRSDLGSFVLDIISKENDRLSVSRTHLDPLGYTLSAEGAMLLFDINGDGWQDLLFNDYWSDSQNGSSPLGILFNDEGQFDFSNPIWVTNPYPGLEMKEAIIEDFDDDGTTEILIHWAMLYPESFKNLYQEGQFVANRLAIYQFRDGMLVETTQEFIPEYDKSARGVSGQLGGAVMTYIDINGDGYKDIHISYNLEQNESTGEFYGAWKTDYLGAWYFKQTPQGKFIWTEIGEFDVTNEIRSAYSAPRDFLIGNQLQPVDLDGNGIAEFIHKGSWDGSLGFSIYRRSGTGFNLPPTVNINASSLQGQVPHTIDFDASESNDPNGDSLSFAWDFGDGSLAYGEVVSHTFNSEGEFLVTLSGSDGILSASDSVIVSISIGVSTESTEFPIEFSLKPVFPNPFNPVTTITYGLPTSSDVKISITDLLGRKISTIVDEPKAAGYHTVQFNAEALSSGTYILRMQAGAFTATQQITLLK